LDRILEELTSYISSFVVNHQGCSKAEIAEATVSHFGLMKTGKVYYCSDFAIRFSKAKGLKGTSIPGTVIGLRRIKEYDHLPFIICIQRDNGVEFFLANSTFIDKISHSSQRLNFNQVRGSINGGNIFRVFDGISNVPENFIDLFEIHKQYSWEENFIRIVERTSEIIPTGQKFTPSKKQQQRILESPMIASSLSNHSEYIQLYYDLDDLVREEESSVLKAAEVDNINLRGNAIEQIITKGGNFHSLEDITRTLSFGPMVKIDIKTKILNLASSPTAYNIDKLLRELATGRVVFSFFFIGIDVVARNVKTCLVSIFDRTILNSTVVQFHWAGRNSRGVTQLTGDFSSIFDPDFSETIDVPSAVEFLRNLVDL